MNYINLVSKGYLKITKKKAKEYIITLMVISKININLDMMGIILMISKMVKEL